LKSQRLTPCLLATKCVPKGQTISDADIASLMAAANFRG
jgi:hypothetical protein